MSVLFFNILAILLFFLIGCADSVQSPEMSTQERLTIQDLQPKDSRYLQPQIIFNWVEFEIDADKIQTLETLFTPFSPEAIVFQNASLYKKNGISVFWGTSAQRRLLTQQLPQLGAQHRKRTIMMTMDKTSEFYPMTPWDAEQSINFTAIGSNSIVRDYPAGQLGFMITPELTSKPDTIKLDCQPAFMAKAGFAHYSGIAAESYGAEYLPPGPFKLNMTEGCFLILAPNRPLTQSTLDNFLFGKKDKARIYVIVFINAGHDANLPAE